MQTQQNTNESLDSTHLAYGREVAELLSQSHASTWVNDLWDIYSGYMIAQPELGYNPRASHIFASFKELLFFFQRIGEMKK
ncbi:hypothetical protein DYBT9623_00836 [Dyadobacter sp. CECT 9623]|jgi:hypothetical protein|uniref:Uncharacterized protein n=1 Tax=Dyadobacter linearis TaxID=2823330 RepID=A0ABN7R4P4_9BACT|nr:hypothetical protein [Dyadobacter sp. CECT 9623]CAG5068108.1 hypothetical protein DYBT9623_00836 [Dyadobacter sp. CECT 9623]